MIFFLFLYIYLCLLVVYFQGLLTCQEMSDFYRYVLSAMKYFMVEIYLITLKVVLYKKDHIWKVNIVSWSINLISSMTKTIFQVTSWRKESRNKV